MLKEFNEYMCKIFESFKVNESSLIEICQKELSLKELAHLHLGINYKKLLATYSLGQRKGELLRNNLEKEYVRKWMEINKFHSLDGKKNYLLDDIMGEICEDRDLLVANSVIQWLGSNVGMEFVKSVLENNKIE